MKQSISKMETLKRPLNY